MSMSSWEISNDDVEVSHQKGESSSAELNYTTTQTVINQETSISLHYIYAVILLLLAIIILALVIVICRGKLKDACCRQRGTTEVINKFDSIEDDNRSLEERLPPLYEAIVECKSYRHTFPRTERLSNHQQLSEEPIYVNKILLSDYITPR